MARLIIDGKPHDAKITNFDFQLDNKIESVDLLARIEVRIEGDNSVFCSGYIKPPHLKHAKLGLTGVTIPIALLKAEDSE